MPSTILLDAGKRGIHLYLNGSELAFKAPQGALTPELRQSIVANKPAIIALLQAHQKSGAGMPRILPLETSDGAPLSFAQQRLWLLNQIDGGSTHYNMPNGLRLQGTLDRQALARAFDIILERHASLRTCFGADAAGQAQQTVQQDARCTIEELDLSSFAAGEGQLQLAQAMATEASRPFDLERDLMLRVVLVKMAEQEHVLLVTMHHIASDGWSTGILIQEFCTLYRACVNGEANPLPPLPVQYTDYAHWQRNWLQGDVFDRELGYWERQLASLPVVHGLPLDGARPAIQGFAGQSHTTRLDGATCAALQALCLAEGGTLFSGLHAAFAVLLARYSNETDIVIGIPTANREQPEIAGLIGFFVNTLVLRSDLAGAPGFRDIVRQSQRVLADAYAHQQVPFEQIVEQLQPERSLSHHPLFQVVLVLQNEAGAVPPVPGLTVSPMEDDNRVAKYDLLLNVTHDGDGLCLRWDFNVDLFEGATIARMSGQFERLLKAMLAAPQASVYAAEMLNARERTALLANANLDGIDYPAERCIHELFEAQAALAPEAVALSCEGRSLSYRELNEQANRLAHYLVRERGVKPETLVGICMERSPEMIVAILAVLKAGGAYVPLDPDYPAARLAYMRADASLATILTQTSVCARLALDAACAVQVDSAAMLATLAQHSAADHCARGAGLDPSALAYVIYTSGSTGNPKGVLVDHRNVCRLFSAAADDFRYGAADVWTMFHSFAFDFSVWEIWGALLHGGRLVVVPHWVSRSADDFRQLVQREQVTVLSQTPSAFYQFIAADAGQSTPLALRYVVFGGEALSLAALAPWIARHGDAAPELINMYGITETTVHVTYRRLKASDIAQAGEASLIGRPLADLGLMVLNSALSLAPPGVAGEMYVRGQGLARGYLNQPELTGQRFIANPFSNDPADRLYKSGDLARWLPSGELEYLGRIDQQVKIRGFRIELGEIEAALLQHADVSEAAVLARDEPVRLVAYLVAAPGGDQAAFAAQLRASLRLRLPDYMVPAAFVLLPSLPLTAHGKLDRKALPAPDLAAQLSAQYRAPETAAEATLCAVLQEVLGVERVGADDNFFTLGGDSIQSIKVVAIARQHGLSFSVKDLFTTQTPRTLARFIADSLGEAAEADVAPFALLDDAERARLQDLVADGQLDDAYPLSTLQQGMIFHHQMTQERGTYHDIFSFRLNEPWEQEAFSSALAALMAHHELLRSLVSFQGERLLHLIHKQVALPLAVHDLRGLAGAEQEQRLLEWTESEKCAAFDWTRPLWSAVIHRLSDASFEYSLSFHHALMDGWSVATMNAELFQLYRQARAGALSAQRASLPYRHFVAAELAQLASAEARDYWRAALADAELPWWTGRQKQASIQNQPWTLELAQSDALQALARRLGVQEKSVYLAAHMVLMSLLNGKAAVTTSVVFNGRPERLGSERTLGLFLNSLPVHFDGAPASWQQLIVAADRQLRTLTAHRQYPLGSIQRDCGLDFSASLFNFTNFSVYDEIGADLSLEGMRGFEETNYLFSLTCSKNSRTNEVSVLTVADGGVFDAAFLERIRGYMFAMFAEIAADCSQPIERARLIGRDERDLLLADTGRTQKDYPRHLCVHELFEGHASATPDAPAVTADGRQWSYGEINAMANRLAHYLAGERKVRPDTLVGICMVRSVHMIVAILGVMKSGAAYVPLDPDYPSARLAYMLDDAALGVVLTQQHLAGCLPHSAADLVCLDAPEWQQALAAQPCTDLSPAGLGLDPSHLVYVIYTSGSTGNPKGVAMHHRGVVNYLAYTSAVYFAQCAGGVASSPLSFDATVTSLIGPLAVGKPVQLVAQDGREIDLLAECLLQASAPAVFKITPAHMESLAYRLQGQSLPNLAHWLIIGGDQLSTKLAAIWKDSLLPAAVLVNEYGPTETVVGCSTMIIEHTGAFDRSRPAVSIGKAIDNIQQFVLDANLGITPLGVPGELCIGGAGVGRMYLNRAQLTAEKFIANPYHDPGNPASSPRLYRSGDLVRQLPDLTLEFLGRIDHQVKIRGFRIELGEIESALASHGAVQEALVLAIDGGSGERRLVAYVAAAGMSGQGAQLAVQLRQHLAGSLPEFMLPSACVVLDAFPLTPNGKIDRKALPAPDLSQLQAPYVAPRNATEQALCGIWQAVLGVERVGVADNFFQLGGHSLLAMKLLTAVQAHFDLKLGVKLLFDFPDVQGLAAYLDVLRPAQDSDHTNTGAAGEKMEAFEL